MIYKISYIGFGVVANGLAEILLKKQKDLFQQYNIEFTTIEIYDFKLGNLRDPSGLNMQEVLKEANTSGKFKNSFDIVDILDEISQSEADIIIEASYTNIETGEPAISHIKRALNSNKHVITTNKGPIALALDELLSLAGQNKRSLFYEGTVMSGTPVINLVKHGLSGNKIVEIRGILNGTTNYILTQMESGLSFDRALEKAQDLGYAEANADGDVDGWDALAKVIILAKVFMNKQFKIDEIPCNGISHITQSDIESASKKSSKWKLIGTIRKENDMIDARVAPELISEEDPLASINDATNALSITTDTLGTITISGPGAGKYETGYALLNDLLEIHRNTFGNKTITL